MGKIKKIFSRKIRQLPQYRGNTCLNCGHPLELSHRYCPNCAQLNSTKNITVRDFIEEFLGSIIDYDSRLFQTIKAMLLRPGQITLDYLNGKRITYTNPFRFLLSLAIVYFLFQQFTGNYRDLDGLNLEEKVNPKSEIPLSINIRNDTDSVQTRRTKEDLKAVELLIREKGAQRDSILLANPKHGIESISGGMLERYFTKTSAFLTLIREHELNRYEEALARYNLQSSKEDRFSFESAQSLLRLLREPGGFINVLLSRLPLVTFFFLPIFSLFPWLMYIRKKYTYTDNLVFGFHMQSLFFILLLLGLLAESLAGKDFTAVAVMIFSVYLYAAMRRFYKQGIFKTTIKYLLLNTIFIILAGIVAVAFLLGTAVTY